MSDPKPTVLVTGATGLLGRQVVRAFERNQWHVKGTGLSRADGQSVLKVDLADAAQVEKALGETKCVSHFANQPQQDETLTLTRAPGPAWWFTVSRLGAR